MTPNNSLLDLFINERRLFKSLKHYVTMNDIHDELKGQTSYYEMEDKSKI